MKTSTIKERAEQGNVVTFPRAVAPPKGRSKPSDFVRLAARVEQTCPTCIVDLFTTLMSDQIKKRLGGATVPLPSGRQLTPAAVNLPPAEKMIQLQMAHPSAAVVIEKLIDDALTRAQRKGA